MPTYQYECGACAHEFEELQSMTEPKLRKCPECGKLKLHRLIGSGSGVIFKGTGFYETDFKRKPVSTDSTGSVPLKDASSKSKGKNEEKATNENSTKKETAAVSAENKG